MNDLIVLAGSIDPNLEVTARYQYAADWPGVTALLPSSLVVANREIRALKPELEAMLPLWPKLNQRVSVLQGDKDDLVPAANVDLAQKVLTKLYRLQGMK